MTRPIPRRARREKNDEDDEGSVTVEMAIAFPVVITLTLLVLQTGLWYYANQTAQAAAREGVDAGRAYQAGGAATGTTRAQQAAHDLSGDLLTGVSASPDGSTVDRIRITVSGDCVTVLPGIIPCHVSQHAEASIERWTNPAP